MPKASACMLSYLYQPARLENDLTSGTKQSMLEKSESLKSRLLTLILLTWVIFVNLAYYWNLIQAYGPRFMERLRSLL